MVFTHIFAKKSLKRRSADHRAPETELNRQDTFSSEGSKRRRISKESSRSPNNAGAPTPEIMSVGSDDGSAFTVSIGDSATISSTDSLARAEQSSRRSSVKRYWKSLFKRHDSHQVQTETTPLDPFEQAYMGQLAMGDIDELLKSPEGPSDFWRRSPLFKDPKEEQKRRESSWSTESAWMLQEPAASPFPPLPSPQPQPPRDQIRWAPISWIPSKLRPRRLSAKSKGKRPQRPSPVSPSIGKGWQPVSPPQSSHRPSASGRSIGGLKITFDSPSSPSSPSSPRLGPSTRNTSIPALVLGDSRLPSADDSAVSSEMMFRMSQEDSEAQSDTNASMEVEVDSEEAVMDLDVAGWPTLQRLGEM
jgi:hypothetical protein